MRRRRVPKSAGRSSAIEMPLSLMAWRRGGGWRGGGEERLVLLYGQIGRSCGGIAAEMVVRVRVVRLWCGVEILRSGSSGAGGKAHLPKAAIQATATTTLLCHETALQEDINMPEQLPQALDKCRDHFATERTQRSPPGLQ